MTETITLSGALNRGLRRAMEDDLRVVVMGEDVGTLGGVFRVTDGLKKDFGELRVIDTPLTESGIAGTAIGLAMRGYRPVCEIQFDGFVFPAFDQIVAQAARLRNRTAGAVAIPLVVRIPFGGGIGAVEHHSESPEAYFAHSAGLKVVSCSTPSDAYWMIQQAIRSDDPVIFFEPKRRYWVKGTIDDEPPGLHEAKVVRPGDDVTVVGYGPTVQTCLEAAAHSARSVEVIDARSVWPLDLETILSSVRRTGRLVVVHEAPGSVSVSSEIAARIQDAAFYSLEAPVQRVTGYDTPYPPAKLEEDWLPSPERVLDAIDRTWTYH